MSALFDERGVMLIPNWLELVAELGAAIGVIVVVRYFLAFLGDERKAHAAERKATSKAFLDQLTALDEERKKRHEAQVELLQRNAREMRELLATLGQERRELQREANQAMRENSEVLGRTKAVLDRALAELGSSHSETPT